MARILEFLVEFCAGILDFGILEFLGFLGVRGYFLGILDLGNSSFEFKFKKF